MTFRNFYIKVPGKFRKLKSKQSKFTFIASIDSQS